MKPRLNLSRLAWRGVQYHRRSYLYVFLSAATATAIITGALLVGDSMRGSLTDRVEERLGHVDHLLQGATFFREALPRELETLESVEHAVPAIRLPGTVIHADSQERAEDVSILGVPSDFWDLWGRPAPPPEGLADALEGRSVIINAHLASEVGASGGDAVLVQFERAGGIPAEHAFGSRGESTPPLRLDVARILPDEGLAVFRSTHGQRTPKNVFLPLALLQKTLEKEGLVNTALIASATMEGDGAETTDLAAEVRRIWTLEDAGLRLRTDSALEYVALESRELLLSPAVEAGVDSLFETGAEEAGPEEATAGIERLRVLTHLANTLAVGDREVPYSTVTAIGEWVGSGSSRGGKPVFEGHSLNRGEILLGEWVAGEEDLQAEREETLRMDYYVVGAEHELVEKSHEFEVAGVIPLEGLAADPTWTPDYPGIADADSVRSWEPPFPVNLDRVRDRDEDYWDAHKATPKAFVTIADGQKLWQSRFGSLTAIRFRSAAAEPMEELAGRLETLLERHLRPERVGTRLVPVKREGLEAAQGSSDFSGLFLALSFFLIVAALMLLAMTFRLSCERRVRELGVLAAVGYRERTVRQLLLLESSWVVAAGSVFGVLAGLGYAALLVVGLRTLWKGAVNAPFLALHAEATSLIAGGLSTAVLAVLTTFLVLRRVTRIPPRQLVAGVTTASDLGTTAGRARRARRSLYVAYSFTAVTTALLLLGSLPFGPSPEVAFFVGGTCLLLACIALIDAALHGTRRGLGGWKGLAGLTLLGGSYAGRFPGRSLFTITLIACATFIIVTVSASRPGEEDLEPSKDSGDGGFALLARSSIPLTASLSTGKGREKLVLGEDVAAALERSTCFAFRVRTGDDISCLNLYRPRTPRLAGAPEAFIERGGFAWSASLAETEEERANPWLILRKELPDGAVPVVGDASAVTWILHSGLGKDVTVEDSSGRELKLRIVGLLKGSLFQGELVLSEDAFLRHFPDITGDRLFLFEAAPEDRPVLLEEVEADLEDYGFDITSTAEVLAGYRSVTNTYLSTFQLLGWLGLLLGTLGLAAILLRNTNDRRAELALLRALGFSRLQVRWVVLSETLLLLLLGLGAGGLSAVTCLIPTAERAAGGISWPDLLLTLATVFVTGLLSALLALRAAMRAPLIPTLRAE